MRNSDFILKKMQHFYDWIFDHPGCTMIQLCAEFESPAATIRHYLHRLIDGKHVSYVEGPRSQGSGSPKLYSAVQGFRPVTALPRRPRGRPAAVKLEQPRPVPDCKRIITKAKQIGMGAYADLPREFFGRQVGA